MYGDDVRVRVAVFFPDFLQLWIRFIDICIQLQKQESESKPAQKHMSKSTFVHSGGY